MYTGVTKSVFLVLFISGPVSSLEVFTYVSIRLGRLLSGGGSCGSCSLALLGVFRLQSVGVGYH